MGQRTMLYIVEKVRDERTNKKLGYKFCGRYYQWGIGRTMPLNILGGILAAYNGGFYDGIHAEHICPETGVEAAPVYKTAYSWANIKSHMEHQSNNNGAIVVQIDNQQNPKTWERNHVINVSFMIGGEDAYDTPHKAGDMISLREWALLGINRCYVDHFTRKYFRDSISFLKSVGLGIELNFKFDEKF